MSVSVVLSPIGGSGQQFLDSNGNPLSGGKLYSYVAGTTTPLATYTSISGDTANTNPIILDTNGRCPSGVWLVYGSAYKFVLKTSADVLVGTWDNITGLATTFVQVSALPTASSSTRGYAYLVLGVNPEPDHGYVGVMLGDGTYGFVTLF